MKLKIYYRSPVIWNIILFIIFSFVFIYFQEIFRNTSSVVEKELFLTFVKGHYALSILFVLTIIALLKNFKGLVLTLFSASILSTFAITTYNLYLEFSKFSLIILFFYLLIAFYFYQFYRVDTSESYYNPQYDDKFLFSPMLKKINVTIQSEGNQVNGFLTNWSEEGCFIHLEESIQSKKNIDVSVNFEGAVFTQNGSIASISKDKKGLGIKFNRVKNGQEETSLGWDQFYEIIEEMGFKPELLV